MDILNKAISKIAKEKNINEEIIKEIISLESEFKGDAASSVRIRQKKIEQFLDDNL